MKAYYTLMRTFGYDLYVTSHFALRDDRGKNWFAARINELTESDPKNWRPNHKFDPLDPSVILKDYVYEQDSPYQQVFGNQYQKQAAAKKILTTRNTWFHFGDDPTLAQLADATKIVRGFVVSSGMNIGGMIEQLSARLEDLRTGRYPKARPPGTQPATPPVHEAETIKIPDDLPRPSIGGTWIGPIPGARYRLTRAGDLIDPDSLQSVRGRVDGDFNEKLRAWTAIEPRGRELWIDTDGAVGGYIGASPRLLGFLGPDPESDIARGFFTPHFYAVEEGHVVDLDSSERLATPLAASVAEGTTLRVTTYGDVVTVGDEQGIERVATVTSADWFAGHLR